MGRCRPDLRRDPGPSFLRGLASGDLLSDRFAYYIAQDADYLRDSARALAVIGVKAPTHADAAMLARHAAGTVDVELTLRGTAAAAGLGERGSRCQAQLLSKLPTNRFARLRV